MKINRPLMILVIFIWALIAGACSKSSPAEEVLETSLLNEEAVSSVQAESITDEAGPVSGGVLIVTSTSAPLTLDPASYTSSSEADIMYQIGETLVIYNEDNTKLMPGLAREWQVSEDGREYHFLLRDDVYFQPGDFQPGRLVTGSDVKYSLERIFNDSANDRICRDYFDYVEVVSDRRVTIHLQAPCQYFLDALTDIGNMIVPFEEVEGWGEDFGRHLIGTGPYMLSDMALPETISLSRHENYWRKYPYLDGVEIRIVPDTNTALAALLADEIHVLPSLSVEAIQNLQPSPLLYQFQSLNVPYIRFNMVNGPTADKRVREALLMAIDVDGLVAGTYRWGDGVRAYQPLSPLSWAFAGELNQLVPKYNPEAAKALLAEAGYGDGLELNLYISSSTRREMMAQLMQHYLNEVGVQLNIHVVKATELTLILAGAWQGNEVDIYGATWTSTIDPHKTLFRLFSSEYLDSVYNAGGYQNQQVDELMLAAASSLTETERKQLYYQVTETILTDYTGLYYGYDMRSWGISPQVRDFRLRADGRLLLCTPFNNVWLETK